MGTNYEDLELLIHGEYIENGKVQDMIEEDFSSIINGLMRDIIRHLAPHLKVSFDRNKQDIIRRMYEDQNLIEKLTEVAEKPLFNLASNYSDLKFKKDTQTIVSNMWRMREFI